MSRFRSRSRDFCQIFEGFGFGFEKFGLGKKVSVSVSENLVSEKSFGFEKFGLEKKSRFWFRKTGFRKRKNQNDQKETRPSIQRKSLI